LRKFAPFWWWILGSVLVGLAGNIYADKIGTWLDKSWMNFVSALSFTIGIALFAWSSHLAQRRERLRAEFDLHTTSEALTPEDVGFKTATTGDVVKQPRRPYYSAYIPRIAIPYADRHLPEPSVIRTEGDLLATLERGESMLLVGVPTEGKTRTLFELVKRTRGFVVVRPKRDAPPSDEAIALLSGCKVICLLDDINSYSGTPIDLGDFFRRVADIATSCVIAGATRDGPELAALQLRTTSLYKLYESIDNKWILQRPTADDKANLSALVGAARDAIATTYGSICMRGAYELMVLRFNMFDEIVRDTHRAIQLLAVSGVEPFTYTRIIEVLAAVFGHRASTERLRRYLGVLAENGFLVSGADKGPVVPEIAYFLPEVARVFYSRSRVVENDIPAVVRALADIGDVDGMFSIAWKCHAKGNGESALEYYAAIVECPRDKVADDLYIYYFASLYNAGCELSSAGRQDDAIAAYDMLIERDRDEPDGASNLLVVSALFNKGVLLQKGEKIEQAAAIFDFLIERDGRWQNPEICEMVAQAFCNKALAVSTLSGYEEAIEVCNELIEWAVVTCESVSTGEAAILGPLLNTLVAKGEWLEALGRDAEAIFAYDTVACWGAQATEEALRERVAMALLNKANSLCRMWNIDESIATYDFLIGSEGQAQELRLRAHVAAAFIGKGAACGNAVRFVDEIRTYSQFVERERSASEAEWCDAVDQALFQAGWRLNQLHQFEAAIAAFDALLARDCRRAERVPSLRIRDALYAKRTALTGLGRFEEVATLCDVLVEQCIRADEVESSGQITEILFEKGAALWQLARFEEAIVSYDMLIEREIDSTDRAIHLLVVKALGAKAFAHAQQGRIAEAIVLYETITEREGATEQYAFQLEVINAIVNKQAALTPSSQEQEPPRRLSLREYVGNVLRSEGIELDQFEELNDEIAVLEAIVERAGDPLESLVSSSLADMLANKGRRLAHLVRIRNELNLQKERLRS
jgi:tetratricopeptide (TPR) repeat protein